MTPIAVDRLFRVTAGIVAVLLLAGCASGPPASPTATPDTGPTTPGGEPTDPGDVEPPYFVFENDRDVAYELTVYLVEGPLQEFRVTYSDGSSEVLDQNEIPGHASSVEPTGTVLSTRTLTVEPHSAVVVPLRTCQADTDFWYVYSETDGSLGYGAAKDCPGYTGKEYISSGGGGYSEGGEYLDDLSVADVRVVTLDAGE